MCIAAIASINLCIKAQRALSDIGIFSKIVSLDPSVTRRGCAYGIEFSCSDKASVRSALRKAGVNPSQYIDNGHGNTV